MGEGSLIRDALLDFLFDCLVFLFSKMGVILGGIHVA